MLRIKRKRFQRSGGRRYKQTRPIVRRLRTLAITITVLCLLLVGGGLLLTWYNGHYTPQPKLAVATQKRAPIRSQTKPSPTGQIGVAVQFISTPVLPGANASITVHTNADANCAITVAYNNLPSKDSGLVPKKADESGLATWGWTVPASAPLGKWPVTVNCANLKSSGMVIGNLEVVKTLPSPAIAQ